MGELYDQIGDNIFELENSLKIIEERDTSHLDQWRFEF